MRMIRQTADSWPPRFRQVTEGPASSQPPRPPKLHPERGSVPAQTHLSPPPCPPIDSRETLTLSETAAAPVAFTLNQNSAMCLPLVENGKLIWVHSNQISLQLDGVAELDEAFDMSPYLTQKEMAALAQRCSLHPDQVKVWFMLQRLRYGISWDCEDICEVRRKQCSSRDAQENEELQHRAREEVGEKRREKTMEGEVKEYGGEKKEEVSGRKRAQKERVRDDKWREGGNSEEKVLCNKQRGRKMKRKEGAKRAEDRKVEAVEKDRRNNKQLRKLTVACKTRKRKKEEGEESGVEETGGVGVRREEEQAAETQTTLPVWKNKRRVRLPVRYRTQISQSSSRQEAPQKRVRSHKAKSGALMLLEDISSTFQCPSKFLNAPDPEVSHPDSLQRAQSAPWNSFQCDEKLAQLELFWQSSETAPSTKFTDEWWANWSQVVDNENDHASPVLDQNQALPGPHNQMQQLTQEASVKGENVFAPFSGSEGKAELQPMVEPELHEELTNNNAGELTGGKEAVMMVKNPPIIDIPPILSLWHEKPGTLTKAQRKRPAQHSQKKWVDALCRVPSNTESRLRTKTRFQVEQLRQSFLNCQFPNSGDYDRLMVLTGLPRAQLVQWFGDMRYNVKNRKPHWLKPEDHCRLLARIRHQQQMNALAVAEAKNGRGKTWKMKLEKKEMLIQDQSAQLPPV